VAHYNNHLGKYKNIHVGEKAIVFGTGPSLLKVDWESANLNHYKTFGVNGIAVHEEISKKLDYYFFGHRPSCCNHSIGATCTDDDCANYRPNIEKFCATRIDNSSHPAHFSDKEADNFPAPAVKFTSSHLPISTMNKAGSFDMSKNIVMGHTIIFAPIQFALYMGIRKIYLVGCDCGSGIDWKRPEKLLKRQHPMLVEPWLQFLKAVRNNYNVKFISINPLGLKGIMNKDLFTNEPF